MNPSRLQNSGTDLNNAPSVLKYTCLYMRNSHESLPFAKIRGLT